MGWGDLFTVINKILPSREQRIRREIDSLKKQREKMLNEGITSDNSDKFKFLNERLSVLEKELQNR